MRRLFTSRRGIRRAAALVCAALILSGAGPGAGRAASAEATGTSVSAATPTPRPTTTYIVRAGDTLTRIAAWFGTTPADLIALNKLANPNALAVDQVLIVPIPPTATITPAPSSTPLPTATAIPSETLAPTATAIPPTATESPSLTPLPSDTPVPATATGTEPASATLPPTVPPATETPLPTATETATATLTPGPTVTPIPSLFALGVSSFTGSDAAVLAAQDLGVGWLRLEVDWKTIESVKGKPDFTALDTAVLRASGAGLRLLLTVSNAPFWARNGINEDGPPTDNGTFNTFVGAVAARYAGKVQAYEIWNEPNLRRNWNGQPLGAEAYVALVRGARAAIRVADPAALVISAGLSPTGYSDGKNAIGDRDYLAAALKAGLASAVDGIGAHPFGWGNAPDATCCGPAPGVTGWNDSRTFYFLNTIADYHQIMVDAGAGSLPLWLTAVGWGTADGVAAPATVRQASFGFVTFITQAQQADYLARAIALSRLAGFIGPTFIYNLDGCQAAPPDARASSFYWCYYALLDADGRARPAYEAVKAAPK